MAFWADKSDIIEPLRPFRFRIQESGVDPSQPGSPDDLGYWWWAKTATKPSFEISKEEYQLINHKFRYPGIATWKDVTIKIIDNKNLNDLRGPTRSYKFYDYLVKSGYSFGGTDGIAKVSSSSQYVIEQLDADGNVLEKWTLINPFITNVEFSELSYDSEELSEITITVAYDTAELTQ
jgi:hypothetical protein|tara:strand:- start:2056 stop:2589 length:534 start_codon:yes stop_codon:yes gene_type:complete